MYSQNYPPYTRTTHAKSIGYRRMQHTVYTQEKFWMKNSQTRIPVCPKWPKPSIDAAFTGYMPGINTGLRYTPYSYQYIGRIIGVFLVSKYVPASALHARAPVRQTPSGLHAPFTPRLHTVLTKPGGFPPQSNGLFEINTIWQSFTGWSFTEGMSGSLGASDPHSVGDANLAIGTRTPIRSQLATTSR